MVTLRRLVCVHAAVWVLTATVSLQAQTTERDSKRVLILHSYHKGYAFTENEQKGIDAVFQASPFQVEQYVDYLDAKRISGPEYLRELKRFYAIRYAHADFDAILVTDNDAFDFIVNNRKDLFPDVPVVFCGLNYYQETMLAGQARITGVLESIDYGATIDMALQLRPSARRVVVISDRTTTGIAHENAVRLLVTGYQGRIEFDFLSLGDMTMPELLSQVRNLDDRHVILLLSQFMDSSGRFFSLSQGVELVSRNASVPSFAVTDTRIGIGAVGGKVVSGYLQGKTAAEMVLRILQGESVDAIPIHTSSPNEFMFDAIQLKRWGIPESALPSPRQLVNETLTFYQRYGAIARVAIAVFVLMAMIITVLTGNIMRRRRAEEALREQQEFLRKIIDLNPNFIMVKDVESRYCLVNQAVAKKFGTTVENLLGKSIADFNEVHQEVEGFRKSDQTVIRNRQPMFIAEEKVTLKSGRVFWLQTTKVPMVRPDGTCGELLAVGVDITDRKQAEAERERMAEQLRQSQKMQAVGQLAGGVAHNFNNLLQIISGSVEMLADRMRAMPAAMYDLASQDALDHLRHAAAVGVNLTRQLLAFCRRQTVSPRRLVLNQVVVDMEDMLRGVVGEAVELSVQLSAESGDIYADRAQVEQVIVNLVLNARDAMPDGGTLTIRTWRISPDSADRRLPPGMKPGIYEVLRVADTGVGMSEETRRRLFEPFYTTKPTGEGLGLGLATVYGIMQQSGGHIEVHSGPGKGTSVDILWPAQPAELVLAPTDSALAGCTVKEPSCDHTILLCDDEPLVRQLIAEYLKGGGYTVLVADDGPEALNLARSHGGMIDLLLADVTMPKMNGRELAEAMKMLHPRIRVVLMSGYDREAVGEEGNPGGHYRFLSKPFEMDALLQEVQAVLSE